MPDERDKTPSLGSARSFEDRLDSWKEIAAYLGRGIRTVQRWEREEGLPVHRLAHEKRGSIYAQKQELAAWWESRRLTLAAQPSDDAESEDAPARPRVERATRTSAATGWPALSSDARLLAYVSDSGLEGMAPQIWIQQIGGAALRLTSGERGYSNLSFSKDDTRIIFTGSDHSGQHVYEIPTLGGEPRPVQRAASRARVSPDGQWFVYVPLGVPGIRIAAGAGAGFRTLGSALLDVTSMAWSPDSRSVLVLARSDPTLPADWWIVPADGGAASNTGFVRGLREAGLFVLPVGFAWVNDSLVFSAAGREGVNLYRQRIVPATFQIRGAPERLTSGDDAVFPAAGGGRVAFLSARSDSNLWSVAIDAATGAGHGPPRRMTRGPGILGYLSLTGDCRTLAYSSVRLGEDNIFLRRLDTGSETTFADGPAGSKGYPAISPSGHQLAFGTREAQAEVRRPIFIASLAHGGVRMLGEDCGGRPRQWVDERLLMIERFARLNSIALVDTETGSQHALLESPDQSITNARLSPDRRWIAFDASRPGEPASVLVAAFRGQTIPNSEWVLVDRSASHPFWSADGQLLYYTPAGANSFIRSAVRARRFASVSGLVDGEPSTVYASTEMVMPAYLPGTAPIATPDEIILVLGDFRGDVFLLDL